MQNPALNKLTICMDTSKQGATATYSLPSAIISAVLPYQISKRTPPKVSLHFEDMPDLPSLRTPINIGVTTGRYIYAGEVLVGFFGKMPIDAIGVSFMGMCKHRDAIPYFFLAPDKVNTYVIAIDNVCHSKQFSHELYAQLSAELQSCTPVTTKDEP